MKKGQDWYENLCYNVEMNTKDYPVSFYLKFVSDSHHPYCCSGESLLGHDVVEVVHGNGTITVGISAVNHLL